MLTLLLRIRPGSARIAQWLLLVSLMLASVASGRSSTPEPRLELARAILADADLIAVRARAQTLLKSGFNAGSGYGEVWIRDFNTFIEQSLEVNDPKPIREALLRFFQFQGPSGDIVDGYIPRANASVDYRFRSAPSAPGLLAHKNTVETDQESSLVQAVGKYVAKTGDVGILDESIDGRPVRARLAQALEYVRTERFATRYGLVWGATTVDWGDVQPEQPWGVELDASSHRAIGIYDNAMYLLAVQEYLRFPGLAAADAAKWEAVAVRIRRNARRFLWDGRHQKFIPHLYLAGSPFPKEFDEHAIYYLGGTAVAIEAGLLTRREVATSLRLMRENVRRAGAASIGLTVYPPYPAGFFKNPSMVPYAYQNGGDWCWFGGRMVQQLIRLGFIEDGYRELKPMVARVQRAGDFHEWWSRDNQPRGSGAFRGSAGVLGQAIEMLQAWATATVGAAKSKGR
jgi:glycogen debranching enzyme